MTDNRFIARSQRRNIGGFSMIEVLITLLVFSVGLLGYASLQNRAQKAQLEVYQRVYALNLVDYMVDQVRSNPLARGCYGLAAVEVGTGFYGSYTCSSYGTAETQAQVIAAVNEWSDLLKGSGEVIDGNSVGGLLNARGCIIYDDVNETYTISVVWQGLVETIAPTSTNCGATSYGGASSKLRRAVTYVVQPPTLDS
ncbi:type IV pilus modification protein PilV [Porticoccaceae bacterium]|jgi:type IV pilus assembly protein PilV|nr:type IV pilus modification protein PilV [Porticoccaceae bacterium]